MVEIENCKLSSDLSVHETVSVRTAYTNIIKTRLRDRQPRITGSGDHRGTWNPGQTQEPKLLNQKTNVSTCDWAQWKSTCMCGAMVHPRTTETDLKGQAYNRSPLVVQAGGLVMQGRPWPHSKFEASL